MKGNFHGYRNPKRRQELFAPTLKPYVYDGPDGAVIGASPLLSAGIRAEFAEVYRAKVKAERHCRYCRMKRPPSKPNSWWTEHQWDCLAKRLRRPHIFDYLLDPPHPVRWEAPPPNITFKEDSNVTGPEGHEETPPRVGEGQEAEGLSG